MKSTYTYITVLGGIIVLIFLYIVFYVRPVHAPIETENKNTATHVVAQSSTSTDIQLANGATIQQISLVASTSKRVAPRPLPDTTRAIVFSSTVDTSLKTVVQTKVDSLKKMVTSDPTNFAAWIDLGIYHKVAGDYVGAKIYWDYAGRLAPTDFISFGNLGNMYAYNLHDMPQAEIYYNQAISHNKNQAYLYFQLAQAYKEVGGSIDKARETVAQGLRAMPNNKDLLSLQASLQTQ